MAVPPDFVYAERLLAALALSSVVGLERELKATSVGLRTHALVGVTTALFVILAELTIQHFAGQTEFLKFDPLALLGATVSGVSFLGAGAIIASSASERRQSLTSAASILGTAGLGVACGLGHYFLATMVMVLMIVILYGYRRVELRILGTRNLKNSEEQS